MSRPAAVPAVSTADRATDALQNAIPAAEARRLWEALADERDELAEQLSQAEDAAIDPLVKQDQARKLRADADALQFQLDRLDKLRDALGKRVKALEKAETIDQAGDAYRLAKAERDALAAEIEDRYPELAAELIALIKRVQASNDSITRVNSNLGGREWLVGAEEIARGRSQFAHSEPSLVKNVQLVTPKVSGLFAWPTPHRQGAGELIAGMFRDAAAQKQRRAKKAA